MSRSWHFLKVVKINGHLLQYHAQLPFLCTWKIKENILKSTTRPSMLFAYFQVMHILISSNKKKTNLSRLTPGVSEEMRAINPILYIWSAIDSGPATSLFTHPALLVDWKKKTQLKIEMPILIMKTSKVKSKLKQH